MEREFRKRLEREWRVIFSSNESIQRYFNEGKLFSRDARSRRERERDREINLGAIEIKILLNCCSFGRNMVETFVGDEKKKKFVFITITGIESAQCCTYTTHVYVSCSGSRQFGLSLYLIDTRKRRERERERKKRKMASNRS